MVKLKKGSVEKIYVPIGAQSEPISRDDMLYRVQGKTLSEGKEIVGEYEAVNKTTWVDKYGNPQATSLCDSVLSISVTPSDYYEKRRLLLDNLKESLDKIEGDDCSIEDVRRALRAQAEYIEYTDKYGDE